MAKTVLITGSSSGFGKHSVDFFQQKGWNVAATLRSLDANQDLINRPGIKIYRLDVTQSDSIHEAVAQVIQDFGSLDILVNNAGYAAVGVLEAASEDIIRRQLDTNLIGLLNVIKAVLPQMRKQRAGVVVNLSSVAGRVGVPFNSLYNATKFAVEGLTESLQYELNPLGIRLKLIEPSGYKTDFAGRSMTDIGYGEFDDYRLTYQKFTAGLTDHFSHNIDEVARTIFEAATDGSDQLRYPVGPGAKELLEARKAMDDGAFKQLIARQAGL